VLAGEREVEGVLEQRHARELVRGGGGAELEQQREVDLAGAQARLDLLGLALRQGQLDLGVARAEARDRERHQRRPRGREGGHPQATTAQAGDRPERRLGGLQPREDPLGVSHERLSRRGQGHPARVALQQRHPGFGLERGDLLGDRGLRVVERVRRGREGAAPGDLVENLQTRDIKHK
jgi:hypothetical protein